MKRFLMALILAVLAGNCWAEDFVPPQAYPVGRYVEGWMKNPFNLKTAPVAVVQESFAKDLVLGSIVKIGDQSRVTVINTKTHVRTPLSDGQDSEGMKIKAVHLEPKRSDTYVEIESGTQSAVLRYDESVLKQYAAHNGQPTASGAPMVGSTGVPGQPPVPMQGMQGGQTAPPPTSGGQPAPGGMMPPTPPPGMMNPSVNPAMPTSHSRRQLTAPVPPRPNR